MTTKYFFCGIGGSGMLPLAYLLKASGADVAGSDRSRDQGRLAEKFADLERHGIRLFPQDGSGITSGDQVLVASAAVESTVPDVAAAERVNAKRMTRAELLANLFNAAPERIAIGGTSGKSTTTGMTGWILYKLGRMPTIMNGAVMSNFATADQPFASAVAGAGDTFVTEVDESDGSIALFDPTVAVLNNVAIDHKPMPELRDLFGSFIGKARTAIVNADNAEAMALAEPLSQEQVFTFSLKDKAATFYASDLTHQPDGVSFTLHDGTTGRETQVMLPMPGAHNVANALAAIGAATATGIDPLEAARALESFKGIRRRTERVGSGGGITVYDDFGHNPDKISATLSALHEFDGRLVVFFQPHGFGPLKLMKDEFIACFAEHLGDEDVLIVPEPVYYGGTADKSISSAVITQGVAERGKNALHVDNREIARVAILTEARPGDRIVVMGARDDTLTEFANELLQSVTKNPINRQMW